MGSRPNELSSSKVFVPLLEVVIIAADTIQTSKRGKS